MADQRFANMASSGAKVSYAGSEGVAKLLARGEAVEIDEVDISGNLRGQWLHKTDNGLVPLDAHTASSTGLFSLSAWKTAALDAFLPVGFPHSVSDDYLAYQTYDSLQAFFSTITSLLASRALLQGLGVGDASSSATFALLLTILKDATSRVATIVFAHRFGLRIEPDAKRYRFLADLFNDSAFFLELGSPYLGPVGKVFALATGEALRALCGVAAGASKAALSMHFAMHDNLAELNAKEASQETAVGLIGLLVGTVVVKWVENPPTVVYLMIVLVLAHLWMNYLGVRSVCMKTLNRQRATIVLQEYLANGIVLSPEETAARESIVFWKPIIKNRHGVEVVRLELAQSYAEALAKHPSRRDIVIMDGREHVKFVSTRASGPLTQINILLLEGAYAQEAIRAWFSAVEMAWHMDSDSDIIPHLDPSSASIHTSNTKQVTEKNAQRVPHVSLIDNAELWANLGAKGWDLGTLSLETGAPLRLRVRAAHNKDE